MLLFLFVVLCVVGDLLEVGLCVEMEMKVLLWVV